nr:hypothetical protein [uncultured bacterium]
MKQPAHGTKIRFHNRPCSACFSMYFSRSMTRQKTLRMAFAFGCLMTLGLSSCQSNKAHRNCNCPQWSDAGEVSPIHPVLTHP